MIRFVIFSNVKWDRLERVLKKPNEKDQCEELLRLFSTLEEMYLFESLETGKEKSATSEELGDKYIPDLK